ncbi:MAG TPA: YkvA family protein [Allosphingosinicella sp.]|nr:YkvA family protein [Allosphingosinicella sp.]
MFSALKAWAGRLKRDVVALWLAARDPRTPWHARALAGFTAAYALSPIDLIPDFIPLLGYLDDLLIVPAGIWLAVRAVPAGLMAGFREQAAARERPRSRAAAAVIVALWLAAAGLLLWLWLL